MGKMGRLLNIKARPNYSWSPYNSFQNEKAAVDKLEWWERGWGPVRDNHPDI